MKGKNASTSARFQKGDASKSWKSAAHNQIVYYFQSLTVLRSGVLHSWKLNF